MIVFRRIAPLLLVVVLLPLGAHAQRGVPQSGFPSWQERMMQVFANRARCDPSAEQYNACGGTTVRPPLVWNYNMNRAARFHCSNLARHSHALQHNSPCALVSNIADLYAPEGICDGHASCACVGGALGCNPTCSSPWDRMALFSCPGGGRAENVARGYQNPLAVHNGWMNSSGHCNHILGGYVSLGAGWDTNYWTQKFSSVGTVSGTLIAGGHYPQLVGSSATSIDFFVNYYDTGGAPGSALLNIDGECTPMTRERGSNTNGTYKATVSLSGTTCRSYVFVFEDPAGQTVVLPETGSYGLGGSGCSDWAPSAPAMCDVPVAPPTVHTAANATHNPVSETTTTLFVLGEHQEGEAGLTYTWSVVGPAAVSFSLNGSNAAKTSVATFSRAGVYTFTATIRDAHHQSVTSSVEVTVQPTVTTVSVSPSSTTVIATNSVQFTANATDQFAHAVSPAPSFSWNVTSGGSISASGLFSAGADAGGPHTVTATGGGVSGTATVTVTVGDPPTVAVAAAADPNPVEGTMTNLSVLGAHHLGEAGLDYTWSVTGPDTVSFSRNGSNDAKSTLATFSRAGAYTFTATIRDAYDQTVTNSVAVTVQATPTTVSVSPSSATVLTEGTQQFAASANDQFARPLSVVPSFSWSVTGGGAIDSSGLFTAGGAPGGPHTVTATSSTVSGTASVTVSIHDAPVVTMEAVADPNPVTGTTTTLSVLGAHEDGESSLTYEWVASGSARVDFSSNASNVAKTTEATFSSSGDYYLEVFIEDAYGQTVTSAVAVEVIGVLEAVSLSPRSANVSVGESRTFTASGVDQFGASLHNQPVFDWSVDGGGTIDTGGAFVAGDVVGGPFTVTAGALGHMGTASVTVVEQGADTTPPVVRILEPEEGDTVSGIVRILAVATDDDGVALVEFLVNGAPVGSSTDEPHESEWDARGWPLREASIVARAVDLSGNEGESEPVTVHVIEESEIDTPPSVTIVHPEDGSFVAERALWIVAHAEDDVGVVGVSFELDGEVVGTVTEEPWELGVDMLPYQPGEIVIVAIAEDTVGNVVRSDPVWVERLEDVTVMGDCGCASGGGGMGLALLLVLLLGLHSNGTRRGGHSAPQRPDGRLRVEYIAGL